MPDPVIVPPPPPPITPDALGDGLLANLPKTFPAPEKPKEEPPDPEKAAAPKTPASAVPDPTLDAAAAIKKEEEDTPKNLNEREKKDWRGIKEARRKAEDENATLKTKVAELEATVAAYNPEEIQTLKAQLADYEARLMTIDVEKHPKFQAYFNQRTEKLLGNAKAIGGEKIASLLQMPDSEYRTQMLQEEFSNLDPVAQARLGAVMNDIDSLKNQREQELANAGDRWKALQADQEQQAKAQSEQHNAVLSGVLERWSDPTKGMPFMQHREGDKDWNVAVEKRKQLARDIFNGKQSVEEVARASLWAAVAPELVAALNAANKTERELREENAQLKAAKPGLGGGTPDAGDEAADSKLNFMEKLSKYRP